MPPSPPQDAAETLAAYVPVLAREEHAELIRRLAAAGDPPDRRQADKYAATVSGLVMWADGQGLDLEAGTLLSSEVIEQYLREGMGDLRQSSRAAARTTLVRIRERATGTPSGGLAASGLPTRTRPRPCRLTPPRRSTRFSRGATATAQPAAATPC